MEYEDSALFAGKSPNKQALMGSPDIVVKDKSVRVGSSSQQSKTNKSFVVVVVGSVIVFLEAIAICYYFDDTHNNYLPRPSTENNQQQQLHQQKYQLLRKSYRHRAGSDVFNMIAFDDETPEVIAEVKIAVVLLGFLILTLILIAGSFIQHKKAIRGGYWFSYDNMRSIQNRP